MEKEMVIEKYLSQWCVGYEDVRPNGYVIVMDCTCLARDGKKYRFIEKSLRKCHSDGFVSLYPVSISDVVEIF